MQRRFLILLFMLNCFFSFSQEVSVRKRTNMDNDWKFHFGHAADPSKDFNYSITVIYSKTGGAQRTAIDPRFRDSAWRTLNLPHDWVVELPFENSPHGEVESHGYKPVGGWYPATSIGWYRKHFRVQRTDSGQRFEIQFDGIFRDARIWLNGFYLGNNMSGYVGNAYDITDYVNFDRDNVLVVRVDATQYEGWFYEGAGIYRHVWLNQFDNLHIAQNGGVFVHAEVNNNSANVAIETTIENKNLQPATGSVYAYIMDRDGNKLGQTAEQSIALKVNESNTVKQQIKLNTPHLWSLEDPYLYRVVSVVRSGGKVTDIIQHRFGIRTLRMDGNEGFFLNEKHIKLQGVCNHQDHAGVGSALPDYLQYYRIRLLKEMGVNGYRTSHNAPTPELLDACDSLGILVIDEQRLLNSSPEYMDQFTRLLLRDRNHPSVFLWSIGNEEGWVHSTSVGKRLAQSLLAKQQELDPSRTSTYAADLPNVFRGVNEVIPVRGFNYRQYAAADYHRDHPNQPIVGTEMGSTVTTRGIYEKDSVRAYVPDQDITFPWWASRAEVWWMLAANNPFWMGGFAWTGFDYRGEPTPYRWPNINSHFGIMDMCGFPKNIYYYYQSWWTDKDVIHISPHWNWKGKEGDTIRVWVNSNAETVELKLNGKSLGKKEMPRNSHLEWVVNYKPGKLEAIGLKKGKKITASIETTDEAFQIVAKPDRTIIMADGKDATVVNITVTDKKGREVPDASHLIKFSLTGDAKIIGVGNGDPSSHEPDKCEEGNWQRNLFNGKCQLILQAGTSDDNLQLTASTINLQPATTSIQQSIWARFRISKE